MADKLELRRDQLSEFLGTHVQVKQFEKLFKITSATYTNTFEEVLVTAGTAEVRATESMQVAYTSDIRSKTNGVMLWLSM